MDNYINIEKAKEYGRTEIKIIFVQKSSEFLSDELAKLINKGNEPTDLEMAHINGAKDALEFVRFFILGM
jgi:hypothetical protein